MKKILNSRKFIFIVLLLALVLLSIYFVSNYQQHLENPNTAIILKNYPIGETVSVSGVVSEIHNNGFTLLDEYNGFKVNYTINSPYRVYNGDHVELLGILEDSYQIAALKILVVSGFDYNFMLIRSCVAFLIFLFFFRRYWRFDFKKIMFRRLK